METKKKHLPVFGVGPIYGTGIIFATIIGIALSCLNLLPFGKIPGLRLPMLTIGALAALGGFFVWLKAAFRIDKYIVSNELCTDGIYAIVRNPCYSGIMLMCTGALLFANNLCLLSFRKDEASVPTLFQLLPIAKRLFQPLVGREVCNAHKTRALIEPLGSTAFLPGL